MPSGPKKRKKAAAAAAAKRKEEDEVGISTTALQHETEERGEMGSSENAKDVSSEIVRPKEEEPSVSERSHEILLEKVEGSEGAEAIERPTKILLEKVSEERVEEAKEEVGDGFVTERSAEIVPQEVRNGEESVAHVTEEEVEEACEVPVSVPADSALSEGESEGEGEESRELPNMGTVILSSASAFPDPAALSEQRASLWNCCGLLDVFKGSQR